MSTILKKTGEESVEQLPALNARTLASAVERAGGIKSGPMKAFPERVIQFGEGAFLRGFVDWMINRMNGKGLFNGRVVVVQPIAQGQTEALNRQDGVYTVLLRGVVAGRVEEEAEVVTAVSRGINPYADFQEYLQLAEEESLRFIVSNTTEAGIAFRAEDRFADAPPASFPGKLTRLLHARWEAFDGDETKGFVILPCELIERNGDNLKRTVLQTARHWQLSEAFIAWIEKANVFTNTLVDRIVTGYPKDEAAALQARWGYRDAMLNTGEIFHTWVIEATGSSTEKLRAELPLAEAGLNVVWTEDMTPYRERKVRILNGAHTSLVAVAYLSGCDTVKQALDDPKLREFLNKALFREILPTLDLPREDLEAFAGAVLERFANPHIKHLWTSIALNSVSKFKARVLPSLRAFVQRKGRLPRRLTFSLSALLAFYHGTRIHENALVCRRETTSYLVSDDLKVLEAFSEAWLSALDTPALVNRILGLTWMWGSDLREIPGLVEAVALDLDAILRGGMRKAFEDRC